MATPRQVRAEMKRQGLTYGIIKTKGTWYVFGEGSELWRDRCLYCVNFYGKEAKYWVEIIVDMSKDHRTWA